MGALHRARAAPVTSARPFSNAYTRRVGADRKICLPSSKYTKIVRNRNGIVVEMEVEPVVGGVVSPNSRPFLKRPQVAESATCRTVAREKKLDRRAGVDEEFLMPSPKRIRVTHDRNGVETPGDPALGTLPKRMAAELDALHALLRKAELLSSGKKGRFMAAAEPKSEAPAESSLQTPLAKRKKVSADSEITESESPEDDNDFIDICGGVSPVAFQNASPIVAVEKTSETSSSESRDPPEDDDEFVDICGGVSPVVVEKPCEVGNSPISSSDSGSSSSSDSDSDNDSGSSSSSDSDSDSDSDDETVDMPIPPVVLPDENGASAQAPPEPASKVPKSTEPEKVKDKRRAAPAAIPKASLIVKAKVRRTLLEMERAVLPDESIHPLDLKNLCIAEYGRPSIMRQLGLVLKADA